MLTCVNDLSNYLTSIDYSMSNHRQGYPEDYQRANRSAYEDYYADYYKKPYDYSGKKLHYLFSSATLSLSVALQILYVQKSCV